MPFFSAVRLGLYIVYELTWSLKTKTFETYALEKILDLVIVTTCKSKYSVLISSRGQTLRTLASYNWTDFFFSGGGTFFFFCVSPNIFIFSILATMFNNRASLASSQFYVTRYNKWTYPVRLITLLIVNFLFLWPFTITAMNTFLEGSDFHFHYIGKQWLQATGKNRTYLPDVGHKNQHRGRRNKTCLSPKAISLPCCLSWSIRYAVINSACLKLSESKAACIIAGV